MSVLDFSCLPILSYKELTTPMVERKPIWSFQA